MNDIVKRPVASELDSILGIQFQVLDDGFVRVVDYMGTDDSIVQAARVSYGAGTKKVHEDRGLIRYLMRNRHSTPLEMCEIKLHVRVPMDCWRQWIRHRTASVNEYSTRYSEAINASQKTGEESWREQASANRQGSSGFLNTEVGSLLTSREDEFHRLSREIYEERLEKGVAREQARKDLPLSTYTEAYWKIDLHNLFHFLSLRMDSHAQYEIRAYANVIGHEIVSKWVPTAWAAFVDYRLDSLHLSGIDVELVQHIAAARSAEAIEAAESKGWIVRGENGMKRNREREEFEAKMAKIGFVVPWLDLPTT